MEAMHNPTDLPPGFKMTELGPIPVGAQRAVPLRETELGSLPEDWQVVRLREVATVKYGKAKPKTQGNIPVIGSGGIYGWTDHPIMDFATLVIGVREPRAKSGYPRLRVGPQIRRFTFNGKRKLMFDSYSTIYNSTNHQENTLKRHCPAYGVAI